MVQVALLHKTHSAPQLRCDRVCPVSIPQQHFFHFDVEFPGNEDLEGHLLRSVPPSAHSSVNQSKCVDRFSPMRLFLTSPGAQQLKFVVGIKKKKNPVPTKSCGFVSF